MPDYKHTYTATATDGEFKINTDFGIDFSEIKHNQIEHSDDRIVRESIYPNGFAIKFEQTADKIVCHTNKELIKGSDGSYSVKLD
ncbi:hypothetical protein [Bacillus cereus group sp. BfR-BA-01316]|uniref:hypothetical protein n=1 Tax=Bacillus cereus group sp. BfR-BA-01316 TaxID=2920293 RepID=UPI001F5A6CC5|nr:hypothetical protein [Bacillus cereus group sp. BfR-BA-01316]